MTGVVTSLLAGVAVGAVVVATAGTRPRLRHRVAPYVVGPRARLGMGPDVRPDGVVSPVGPDGGDLALRLEQAGWSGDGVDRFRMRVLVSAGAWAAAGMAIGVVTGLGPAAAAGLGVAAGIAGASRPRAALTRAIEARAERMRAEIHVVDQVLAVRVRSGSSVVGAIDRVVARGTGPVVAELAAALRIHRTGLPLAAALRRVAERTPEPACARTYRALASGTERGTDLGATLLALAEDVRGARREAVRRRAVRRRAAMLVPIVAVLAPVLLLFVAAPLPSIVFGTP